MKVKRIIKNAVLLVCFAGLYGCCEWFCDDDVTCGDGTILSGANECIPKVVRKCGPDTKEVPKVVIGADGQPEEGQGGERECVPTLSCGPGTTAVTKVFIGVDGQPEEGQGGERECVPVEEIPEVEPEDPTQSE